MVEVIVFAEGQTEVKFIHDVVRPSLTRMQVFVKAETLPTSKKSSGGAVNLERVKLHARNTLRNNQKVFLTTFLDLYGLDTSFPHFEESKQFSDICQRTQFLETSLHQEIISRLQCRPERFIPHIQPHEFEALLFSDVVVLSNTEPTWSKSLASLQQVRAQFETPEHINNSYETAPSKRLEKLLQPKYKKTLHGSMVAQAITLPVIEQHCPHFQQWMDKLRALAPV